ncbi:MAG: ABC transporter ATP-binding protein [Planctomycetes bacterium]|nr:ABC transporter ATP-binding protein [Planctomycetota bacterium]
MSSDIAIQVEGLSKRYRLGERHKTNNLREAIAGAITAPLRLLGGKAKRGESEEDILWALRDVAFSVKRGDVVGIIGKNGAGKSTLLKVLSRITEPTSGSVTIRGRVGSLLEVGTGFHPELTGRENIYLNGAILGMRRADINRRFDQIVDFSEVEKFLDTPVKRYSSGMYMRLAFSVAAHLDPEILVVDEVLAVGDATFQAKCLGKMQEAGRSGRTVLFVSHNMDAVLSLCSTALVMNKGRNTPLIPATEAVAMYLARSPGDKALPFRERPRVQASPRPAILADVTVETGGEPNVVPAGGPVTFNLELRDFADIAGLQIGLNFVNLRGQRVLVFHSLIHSALIVKGADRATVRCAIPSLPLVPDNYMVQFVLWDGYQTVERVDDAASMTVVFSNMLGTGRLPIPGQGYFVQPSEWRVL